MSMMTLKRLFMALATLGVLSSASAPAHSQPMMPPIANAKPFPLTVAVTMDKGDGVKTPLAGADVMVEVLVGGTPIKTYSAKAGNAGRAVFTDLKAIRGANFLAKVTHDGINYDSGPILPSEKPKMVTIDTYEADGNLDNIRVKEMQTTVELAEKYLIFMQTLTIENVGNKSFAPSRAEDPRFEKGFLVTLPGVAEGIHAQAVWNGAQSYETQIEESRIFIKGAIPPAGPKNRALRVQLRYSVKLEGADLTYEQPIEYKTEEIRVIVPRTTQFKKTPVVDISMSAPGFETVGSNKGLTDLRQDMDFLIARGRSALAGEQLTFTVRGYPAHEPIGRWLMLGGVLAAFVVGHFLYRREKARLETQSPKQRLQALEAERIRLFDRLDELDELYDQGEIGEKEYDVEVAKAREELALILRFVSREQEAA